MAKTLNVPLSLEDLIRLYMAALRRLQMWEEIKEQNLGESRLSPNHPAVEVEITETRDLVRRLRENIDSMSTQEATNGNV